MLELLYYHPSDGTSLLEQEGPTNKRKSYSYFQNNHHIFAIITTVPYTWQHFFQKQVYWRILA